MADTLKESYVHFSKEALRKVVSVAFHAGMRAEAQRMDPLASEGRIDNLTDDIAALAMCGLIPGDPAVPATR